jgi:hypothetical protein
VAPLQNNKRGTKKAIINKDKGKKQRRQLKTKWFRLALEAKRREENRKEFIREFEKSWEQPVSDHLKKEMQGPHWDSNL